MTVPEHIASALRKAHEELPDGSASIPDAIAKRLGGIPLYGDIGATLLMLLDGSIVEVEHDHETINNAPSSRWTNLALVAGARRYPWLAELIPQRREDAIDCTGCNGRGQVELRELSDGSPGFWCGSCYGVGWLAPEEPRGGPTKS
jgi:hypothetical protein